VLSKIDAEISLGADSLGERTDFWHKGPIFNVDAA